MFVNSFYVQSSIEMNLSKVLYSCNIVETSYF